MNNYKNFKLVRYSKKELVFSSKKDFISALKEFKSENDIIASYETEGKIKTVLISSDVMTQYRNNEIKIYAEEKIT